MDLEKVMSLEGRIYNEMQQAQTKMKTMQDDMKNKFTKTDSLREQFEEEKQRLGLIKKFLQANKNGLAK